MTEIITTIALSSLGIALALYCKGFSDSTAYDKKAHKEQERLVEKVRTYIAIYGGELEHVENSHNVFVQRYRTIMGGKEKIVAISVHNFPITRYHIGTAWDMWHVMSRLSVIICYVTALCAGAYVMAQEPSFRQTLEHYGLYEWLVWAKTPENAMLEWMGFERVTYDSQAWWFWPMGICHAIAGIVGFNLGDRWKGSMWMRYLGRLINGEHI